MDKPKADDPSSMIPGVADVSREGVQIAIDMMCDLESDGKFAELANIENWPREGQPFRNVVHEHLATARAKGVDVEFGFCAVLSDYLAQMAMGTIPDSGFYARLYDV